MRSSRNAAPPPERERAGVTRARSAALAVVAALLLVAGAPPAVAQEPSAGTGSAAEVFGRDCAYCHGDRGRGSARGPSLLGTGELSAFWWLASGRMPIDEPRRDPDRGEPAYASEELDALIDYVARLAGGPPRPRVDPAAGDIAGGERIYREHCMACHAPGGTGAIMAEGRHPPSLRGLPADQVAAAVALGPGPMPSFRGVLDDRELTDVTRYVVELDERSGAAGVSLLGLGPPVEMFVALLGGLALLLLAAHWIGARHT